MSHQDVVPVNEATLSEWEYPPFSGHYDPETDFIWGRGSNDCKNLLIAQLEAIEQLLADGYAAPERTLLLSLGFDEEASGNHGAKHLSEFITNKYGNDSLYAILDEGEGIVEVDKGIFVAAPVVTEKGYVDVIVTINGHGGHSSIPPDHTTIGIAAQLIAALEDSPASKAFQFHDDNPVYGFLTCTAEHSESISKKSRNIILNAIKKSKKTLQALTDFLVNDSRLRDLIRTTTAIDKIQGGVKANALPEDTSFLINHRVDLHSSVNKTLQSDIDLIKDIAKKFNYGVSFMGETLLEETELGSIDIIFERPLEPAPLSPHKGPVWDILTGTIQDVFQNGVLDEDEDIYVTTSLFSGNTDTKYYWNLSKNIYRFNPSIIDEDLAKTLHSVNEHVDVPGHLSAVAFIYEYIVNVNQYGNSD